VTVYRIEADDGTPMPGLDGVMIHGPLPRAGDVVFHCTLDESVKPYKIRVLYVEHTLVLQATATLAASVVVFVEAL
jgi:hypothetical protein